MGQIVSLAAKPKRCNLNQLSQVPTPAAGEHILVSSDNSMNAAGQGNFDSYIVGNGHTAATALELHMIDNQKMYIDVVNYYPSLKMALQGGIGIDVNSALTDYIPVTQGDVLVVNRGGDTLSSSYFDQYYDADKVRVNYGSRANSNPYTYTIPANVYYIRCHFLVSAIGEANITKNGVEIWRAGKELVNIVDFLNGNAFDNKVNNTINNVLYTPQYVKFYNKNTSFYPLDTTINEGDLLHITISDNPTTGDVIVQYNTSSYLFRLSYETTELYLRAPADITEIRSFGSGGPFGITIDNITQRNSNNIGKLENSDNIIINKEEVTIVFTDTMTKTLFTPIKKGALCRLYDVVISSGFMQLQLSNQIISVDNGTDITFTTIDNSYSVRLFTASSSVTFSAKLTYIQNKSVNDAFSDAWNKPLDGVKFTCLGDSITANSYSKIGTYTSNYLGTSLIKNFAVAGATCANRTGTAINLDIEDGVTTEGNADNVLSNQILQLLQWTTAEGSQITWTHPIAGAQSIDTSYGVGLGHTDDIPKIIYIAISVNDTTAQTDDDVDAVLSQTYANLTKDTIASALRWAIETLLSAYPESFICCASPLVGGNNIYYDSKVKKAEIIRKVCNYENVLYVPNGEESGYSLLFSNSGGGLHPNATWGNRIAKFVAKYIRNNYINDWRDNVFPRYF